MVSGTRLRGFLYILHHLEVFMNKICAMFLALFLFSTLYAPPRSNRLTTAGAQTKEHFIAVAANSTNTENHPFTFVWAFGYHTDSGADARGEAVRLCNNHRRGNCWPVGGGTSMRGGCVILVQGSWIDQGSPQKGRLFAGTSTLGRDDAERWATDSCRNFIFSGKAAGTVTAWECRPVGSYCSFGATQ